MPHPETGANVWVLLFSVPMSLIICSTENKAYKLPTWGFTVCILDRAVPTPHSPWCISSEIQPGICYPPCSFFEAYNLSSGDQKVMSCLLTLPLRSPVSSLKLPRLKGSQLQLLKWVVVEILWTGGKVGEARHNVFRFPHQDKNPATHGI